MPGEREMGKFWMPSEYHHEVLLTAESAKMSFKLHIWIAAGRVGVVGKCLLLLFPERSPLGWSPGPARGEPESFASPPQICRRVSALWHPTCLFSKSDLEGPLTNTFFSVVTKEELASSMALSSRRAWGYTGGRFFCSGALGN